MDELKNLLDKELDSFLMHMPEKNGKSVESMLKRVEFVRNNIALFEEKLNLIGNDFLIKNNFNDNDELKILIHKYYFDFASSFGKRK